MKSKYIIYEVLFNKTKKLTITMHKKDLLLDYNHYLMHQKYLGLQNNVNLRKYVLARIQQIIASTFIEY